MAILLYANGLTEEFQPKVHTFSDDELLGIFKGYDKTRSYRLYEVPNTWCVWGEYEPMNKKEDEYNKVGSDILEQPCFSPVLYLHDTEVNPSWRLTDEIIMVGYNDFKFELLKFFDEVSIGILKEREKAQIDSGAPPKVMNLDQTGISPDKRIMFKFDIDKQVQEFFITENLLEFASKVHKFLKFQYNNGHTFVVFADKNMIIYCDDNKVKPFLEQIIALFESRENYEACSIIRNTHEKWIKWKKENPIPIPKKDGPKKKK